MTEKHTASEKPNLSGVSDRERCLAQAREYITKDRTNTYGSAEDNFGNIARILNSLGFMRGDSQAITSDDVAVMMIAVKLARLMNSPGHDDSWIDIAGYAACGMQTANSRLSYVPREYDETFARAHQREAQKRVDDKVDEINRNIATAKRELSEQVAQRATASFDNGPSDKTRYRAECGRPAIHEPHAMGEHMEEDCSGIPTMR